MELIVGYLSQGVSIIVPFIILLGLLIFVHELGHFLVAKYNGVRVEVFSLGFGKKIFSYKKGDTEYCLSIIPFGGYVKMYGDDPNAQVPEDQKKYSFTFKPVGQRIAVVLAGPLMNLFFAFFLFIAIAILGESMLTPSLGDISSTSAAYKAGFRSGDTIVKIGSIDIETWDQSKKIIEDAANKDITFTVARKNESSPVQVTARPVLVPNKNILSSQEAVGEIEGLTFLSRSSIIGISEPTSLASIAGLKTGDIITAVNDKPVSRWQELTETLVSLKGTKDVTLKVERAIDPKNDESITAKINIPQNLTTANIQSALGIESAELYISKVLDNSAAANAGLQAGDRIVSINDAKLEQMQSLIDMVKSYKDGSPAFKLKVLRGGSVREYELIPQRVKQVANTGKEEESYALGVMTSLAYAQPTTFINRTRNPVKAFQIGIEQTIHWTYTTVLSFVRLIQNRVSAKSIGGPIMIGQLASETFKIGLSPFMKIMAIISLNLFVLNLLPVPVLDGGHLLFFSIEALRGAPMSLKKMEIAQQIGLVLLMALMIFAVFNDVRRLFEFNF